jgi:2-polyprenyl-3-methyl-5-hydroxy-6-metoxy-1,4-benzoquinol methylase
MTDLLTATRQLVPEWMDQPDLDPRLHRQALLALDRINSVSLTAGQIWREMRKRLASENANHSRQQVEQPAELTVLDVACGSGGVLLDLWKRAVRRGVSLRLAGCDISATALAVARQQAKRHHVEIDLEQIDTTQELFSRRYDFVISSLFLHHLSDGEATSLLWQMADAARLAIIVTDLRRTRLGYAYAWLGTRLLSRSAVARIDGPRSVIRAFTLPEVQRLAERAGLTSATVEKCWPQRVLLRWWRA